MNNSYGKNRLSQNTLKVKSSIDIVLLLAKNMYMYLMWQNCLGLQTKRKKRTIPKWQQIILHYV